MKCTRVSWSTRWLAVGMAVVAFVPNLFAHYLPNFDTSLTYDAPTLQMISQRAAAGQPLIQAGDTLGVVLQSTPFNGTIDGVGGYMTFYVPPGMQVVGAQFVRPAGNTNGTYYQVNAQGQAAINIGGLSAVDIPELAGLGLGPNINGVSNAVVNSSGLELGTISGIYGDTGIFYSTDPRTVFQSWTNNGGIYRDRSKTNGFVLTTDFNLKIVPITEYDAEQEIGYGMISPYTAQICYPNSSHDAPWGLANVVAGPQSGYAWQYNWLTYSNVLQATGNRALAMKSAVTNVGPWQRIKYPGSQVSHDIPGNPDTGKIGFTGVDCSSLGYDLSAAPLPATTSWATNDYTSTKAVRFSLGATYLGVPRYARVYVKVITPAQCAPIWSDAFGGDAGGDVGGFSHEWRYYNPTVCELLPCTTIQKVANPSTQSLGSNVVFQVTFINSGNVALTNFTISDPIPSGLTYIGANPSPATISGTTLTWNYGTLPAYTNVTIYITNKCGSSGTFFNTATAYSGTNIVGSATASVTVGPVSDLTTYGKSVTPTSITAGATVTYTIGITNSGTAVNGTPLVVQETLPPGFTYQSLVSIYLNGAALSSSFYSISASNPNQPVFSISSGISPGNNLQISFVAKSSSTNTAGTYWNTFQMLFEGKSIGGVPLAPVVIGGASIGNFVFEDWNTNGVPDSGEPGINGVTVTLSNTVTHAVSTQVTATNGYYDFMGLPSGTYVVSVPAPGATGGVPSGYLATTNLGYSVTLTNNQVVTWADFGFLPGGIGAIGDTVFSDVNHNGVFDTGDVGIPNVTVHLYDSYGNQVAKTTTTTGGYYLFTGLATNLAYSVLVNHNTSGLTNYFGNTNYLTTTSDPIIVSNLVTVKTNLNADFGFYQPTPSSLGEYVYLDANNNGTYDAGDAPLANIPVSLYQVTPTSTNLFATTTTTANGQYFFNQLLPGTYLIAVSTNSPNLPATATTSIPVYGSIVLGAGQTNWNNNFPFVIPPPAPPLLYKTVSATTNILTGTILGYTLTPQYTNNAVLANVTVSDAIPAGTVYVNGSANAGGVTNGHIGSVVWPLGSVLAGTNGYTTNGTLAVAGTVKLDNTANTTVNASTASFSLTTGSGNNRLLMVGLTEEGKDSPKGFGPTVTYNNVALTRLGGITNSGNNNTAVELYYLLNPPSGTYNIAITWNVSDHRVVGAVTFSNVDQTTPLDSIVTTATQSGGASVSVPSGAGEMVFDTFGMDQSSTISAGSGQTVQWNQNTGPETGGGSIQAGAGSSTNVTMSWTGNKTSATLAAVNINAATVAGTGIITTNSLSVDHSLVTSGTSVTVTMNLGASSPVTGVTPTLTANVIGGVTATKISGPTPASQSIANTNSFSWVYTLTSGSTTGAVTFAGSAISATTNFITATANSVLVTPALTYQVKVTNSAGLITNVAYVVDTSGNIPNTPSPTVTNTLDGSIGFLVWADTNANGVLDAGEPGLANVLVYISATNGVPIANGPSAVTDTYGHYVINGLTTGVVYTVTYVATNYPGYTPTTSVTTNITLTTPGQYNTNANFGLLPPVYTNPGGASLGYLVYLDANNNTQYDSGDAPLANIPVYLYTNSIAGGSIIATNYTSATGTYYFTNLPPGTYSVAVSTNSSSLPLGLAPEVPPFNDIVLITSQTNYTINFPFTNLPPASASVNYQLFKSVTPTGLSTNGAVLTYSLLPNYTNNLQLTSVTVTDAVPAGTTFLSAGQGGTHNTAPSSVVWNLGSTTSANNGTKTLSNGTTLTIAQRGTATTGKQDNGSTLSINKPTGVVAGDVMIVNISEKGTTTTPALTGWTTITNAPFENGGATHHGALLYRVADSTDSSVSSYSFSLGSGVTAVGEIVAFSGVTATGGYLPNGSIGGPFDVAPGSSTTNTSGSASISGVTAITTASANAAVVMFVEAQDNATSVGSFSTTSPGALTLLDSYANGDGTVGSAWAAKSTAGSTGSGSATLGSSARWGAILLALKPGTTTTYNYTTTTALSANHSLVTNGEPITVTVTVSATGTIGFPVTVSPNALTAVGTSGSSATFGSATPSTITLNSSGASGTFTYTSTAVTAGSTPGVLTFTATPSDPNGNWATGTANTVLITPALTFQATVASTLNQITNIGWLQDTSGNLPSTPSPVVTNSFLGSLGNTVWADLNGNGIDDAGEPGIANVTVYISAENGVPIADGPSAVTDAYGHYIITGLNSNIVYTVTYASSSLPAGYVPTTPVTVSITLTNAGEYDTNANFGLQPPTTVPPSSIGNTVWLDLNNDGLVDNGEVGISNVTVNLYKDVNGTGILATNDFVVATAVTDTNGYYLFSGLGTNHYIVQVPLTNNPSLTNLVQVSGITNPAAVYIATGGTVDTNVNFGFNNSGSIGTTVYYDNNEDNIYETNLGESGVPGATVWLYQDTLGTGVYDSTVDQLYATTTTSTNGTYAFTNLAAGTYFVIVASSSVNPYGCTGNCDNDLQSSYPTVVPGVGPIDTVVLTAGEQYTNANFGYYDQAGLSGTVYVDNNGNGALDAGEPGIPGVTVYLFAVTNGVETLVTNTVTAANGKYSFNPLPGNYVISYSTNEPAIPTYLTPTTSTNLYLTMLPGSEATGYNFGLGYDGQIGGEALTDNPTIGVQDAADVPLANVPVVLSVANGTGTPTPIASTVTGPAGTYLFTGLSNATYYVTVQTNSLPAANSPTPTYAPAGAGNPTATVVLPLGGSSLNNNFGFPLLDTVSGTVYNGNNTTLPFTTGNTPLAGVSVSIYTTTASGSVTPGTLVASTTTGGNGNYSFGNLPPGNYVIVETLASGYILNGDTYGANDGKIAVSLPNYGQTSALNNFLQEQTSGNNANIGGLVLDDTTNYGVIDIPGDTALPGVTVNLYLNPGGTGVVNSNNFIGSTLTGANGGYLFTNLPAGQYIVQEINPPGGPTVNVTTSPGGQPTNTIVVTLAGTSLLNNDFLLGNVSLGTIGQYVFDDLNGNGTYDSGEGISNALVYVDINMTGVYATNDPSALTSSNGFYQISNLPLGTYAVRVATNTLPAGLSINSVYPVGGATNLGYATLSSTSPTNLLMNFGYLGTGAIGQRVFADLNSNGQYDAGEGLSGVLVTLTGNFTGSGVQTITNITGGDGYYQFYGLRATNTLGIPYLVTVLTNTLPAGYTLNTVNPPGGANSSNMVTLTASSPTNEVQNFGYVGTSSLTGNVFVDVNHNGVFDGPDSELAGVTVVLSGSDSLGQPLSFTTTTAANGSYAFNNLPPGYYTLTETQPAAYGPGASIPGNQGGTSVTPNQISVTLPANVSGTGYNFTAWPGSIGNYVWIDVNQDGIRQPIEQGISGVLVFLDLAGTGQYVSGDPSAITDANGYYLITNLPAGSYQVTVATNTLPPNLYQTYSLVGGTAAPQSSVPVALPAGDSFLNANFGYYYQAPTLATLAAGSFQGVATTNGVQLGWTTLSEADVAYFSVNRKVLGEWVTEVPFVLALDSAIGGNYKATDSTATALGTYEYQLVEVDLDGRTVVLGTCTVVVPSAEPIMMTLNWEAGNLRVSWTGGTPPYHLEEISVLAAPATAQPALNTVPPTGWVEVPLTDSTTNTLLLPPQGAAGFFRVYSTQP